MATEGEITQLYTDERGWPLVKALDLVALVLGGVVVIRAVGGLVAGLTESQVNGPLKVPLPTYFRLLYGTQWADLVSGLLLLASVALLALPRMVWDVSHEDGGSRLALVSVRAVGIVAVLTAIAAVVGAVNWLWNSPSFGLPTAAGTIAGDIATVVLAGLCAALAWFAQPFVESDALPGG